MTDVRARYLNGEDVIFPRCQDIMDVKLQACHAHGDRCVLEISVFSPKDATPLDDTDDAPAPDSCSIILLEPTVYNEKLGFSLIFYCVRWFNAVRAHALESGRSGLMRCRQLLSMLAHDRVAPLFGSCLLYFSDRGNMHAVDALLSTSAQDIGCETQNAIVNHRDFLHYSPLMLAAREGHVDIVQRLLSARADVLLRDKFKQSALFGAVERGRSDVVRVLLDARATVNDVDATGQGLLSWAVEHAHNYVTETSALHIIRALVDEKASVNNVDVQSGMTPLSLAARDNHEALVMFLLPCVETAGTTNGWNGAPALINAAARGHITIVRMLIRHAESVMGLSAPLLTESSVSKNRVKKHNVVKRSCGESRIRGTVALVYQVFSTAMYTAYCNGHLDVEAALLSARAQIGI